ncbi:MULTISPECIES: hypothetical protein [Natrialbaceae]|uniref:hypothetical protein n=1 Tax=Natrialbaceae TaxID=1644061 RepID=UPI00207D3B27|nr:hypothetical protein [Natronococcus sp. CG52]
MTETGRFKVFGVYVSEPVHDALQTSVYEAAGVVTLEDYFDATGSVPADDPGAEATDAILADVIEAFAALYDDANFDAVSRLDPDGFELVQLAASPEQVTRAREQFRAAATIRDTDLRTVHTAILAAHFDVPVATADR